MLYIYIFVTYGFTVLNGYMSHCGWLRTPRHLERCCGSGGQFHLPAMPCRTLLSASDRHGTCQGATLWVRKKAANPTMSTKTNGHKWSTHLELPSKNSPNHYLIPPFRDDFPVKFPIYRGYPWLFPLLPSGKLT